MFSFPNFSNHAVLSTRSLETLQRCIQRFILANTNFCHLHFPPFAATAEADQIQKRIPVSDLYHRKRAVTAPPGYLSVSHIACISLSYILLYHVFYALSRCFFTKREFCYFATKLTSLFGTYIFLTTVLPSRASAIFGSAMACSSTASFAAFTGISILVFTLPLICTTISTV